MKAQFNQSIDITLKPTLLLLGLLLSITIVSATIIATIPIIFSLKLVIIALIIFASLYYILRDCLLLLPWSWQRVVVNHLGELRLTNQQGQQFSPKVHASSYVHSQLIVLNLADNTSQKRFINHLPSLILFLNATNAEQHRLLRVWLRWWKHTND